MKGRILQLVNDSIHTQFYGKAVECLKALREGCMRETESESFNAFLHKLKDDYEGKRRDDFWRMLAPNGLTLIHCDEVLSTSILIKLKPMNHNTKLM
jgi:ATP-dependent DNA helicase 2 subunit 2